MAVPLVCVKYIVAGATDYVWNNGAVRFHAGACIYCERVQADVTIVPAASDADGWAEMAPQHEDDCEWLATRAHNLAN